MKTGSPVFSLNHALFVKLICILKAIPPNCLMVELSTRFTCFDLLCRSMLLHGGGGGVSCNVCQRHFYNSAVKYHVNTHAQQTD